MEIDHVEVIDIMDIVNQQVIQIQIVDQIVGQTVCQIVGQTVDQIVDQTVDQIVGKIVDNRINSR